MNELHFNIDVPQLITEISSNNSTWALTKPLEVLQTKLALIAKRAIEIDDPELNVLMLETKLYEVENHTDISNLIKTQKERT